MSLSKNVSKHEKGSINLYFSATVRDILSFLRTEAHPQGTKKCKNSFLFLSRFLGDQVITVIRSWARTNHILVWSGFYSRKDIEGKRNEHTG